MFDNDIFNKNMVCHYTHQQAAVSILKDGRLNFSSLASCDDPRESKQWNFGFIGNEQILCIENFTDTPNIFSRSIINNSMVLCFCGWNAENIDFSREMIPHSREAYYRAGFARSRMWSQYGRKHTGICFVFDRVRIEEEFNTTFNTKKKFSGDVEYQYYRESFVKARKIECKNILHNSIDKALEKQIDTYYHEYFFLKSMDYRDEHEYRLIIIDNDDSISLSIASSLKAVIVGVDFPPDKYDCINELTLKCNCSAERWFLSWQEGRPQLLDLAGEIKKRKS